MPEIAKSIKPFLCAHNYKPSGFGMWEFNITTLRGVVKHFVVGTFEKARIAAVKRAEKLKGTAVELQP